MENKKDKINCSSKLVSGKVKIISVNTLMLQKKNLFVNAAGIACQASVCADDTVAGDYNRNRIVADSVSDRLSRHSFKAVEMSDFFCDFAVGRCFAVRDFTKNSPNGLTKFAALGSKLKLGYVRFFAVHISVEPFLSFAKRNVIIKTNKIIFIRRKKIFLTLNPQTDKRVVLGGERKCAERRTVLFGEFNHKVFPFT